MYSLVSRPLQIGAAFRSERCLSSSSMRSGMRPFETADVVFIETLKAKHATVKAQLTAAERAQDARHAAEIAAEREKADKAFAELLRVADRVAAAAAERALPPWWWLAG